MSNPESFQHRVKDSTTQLRRGRGEGSTNSAGSTYGRIRFIDVMRGLAVLLMIVVHATDAFLGGSWRSGWIWNHCHIIFGYVAPAFIFLSGLTFRIALERRLVSGRQTGQLALRAITVIALGYWLQIPSHSLRIALKASPEQVARFLDCNVLQVIGFGMLFMLGLHAVVRSVRLLAWLGGGLALVVVLTTPFLSTSLDPESLHVSIRGWLLPVGSFPLFPYVAYFFLGVASSQSIVRTAGSPVKGGGLAIAGLLMLLLSEVMDFLFSNLTPYNDFWQQSPQLFLFRLGGLVLVTGLAHLTTEWHEGTARSSEAAPKQATLLERMGQASLGIYVLHLMVIYGSPINAGMRYWYNGLFYRSMTPLEVFLMIAGITAGVWSILLFWQFLRRSRPGWSLWLVRLWWVGFALVFLFAE